MSRRCKYSKEKNENEMSIDEIQEEQDKELDKFNSSKMILENSYYYFSIVINFTFKSIKFIIRVSGIYLLWIVLHYVASQLYVKLCVPNTLVGFVISPFMVATPHCQGLRWIVYNAANIINNMWILMGAWICSTLLIINRENPPDNR